MNIASIGIDLGKTTFHLVALGERNKVLVRKKFSRATLLTYTANLPASLIGLEACAGAHFLGSALRAQGHQVRLIPAQFVKPYRKSNKNDFIDAEAIADAVTKQNMRFVQIKTQEQLDWQAMHRVRDRLMQRRTALINEIRGFLLERGLTFAARPTYLRKNLPTVIDAYRKAIALNSRLPGIQLNLGLAGTSKDTFRLRLPHCGLRCSRTPAASRRALCWALAATAPSAFRKP